MNPKGICVLGSTGSIGTQCLQIIESYPDRFRLVSLAAGKNVDLLRAQIARFRPSAVSVSRSEDVALLKSEFPQVEFVTGDEGNAQCVDRADVEVVIVGIVGFAALAPTLVAARAGKTIALANKESLVVAGALVKREAARGGAQLIPVDSEHNALFQLLRGQDPAQVRSLVLTASGGPLLRKPELPLCDVTPEQAVRHPNWKMGPKNSIDSATLMNKGLELIEAHFLFDMPEERIEIWIHPQSVVHGAIWMVDNTCLAQLSRPDMRSAISYAMSFPSRLDGVIPKLGLKDMAQLEFLEPDETRFPALSLAREALRAGPSHLLQLNSSDEVAVQGFIEGRILFSQISEVIAETLQQHRPILLDSVEAIFEQDRKARELAEGVVQRIGRQ